MKNIYVTSSKERVGKSTFCLALALKLKKEGLNVGYFKPITDRDGDQDPIQAINLLKMDDDPSTVCPVTISQWEFDLTESQKEEYLKKIDEAYLSLSSKYDALVIEGCRTMYYLSSIDLSSRVLVPRMNSEILLLVSGHNETHVDEFILGESFFNDVDLRVFGGLLTLVPLELLERMKAIMTERLASHKIRAIGLIPEKGSLTAPTVTELCNAIDARILSGESYCDNIVEDYLIAAMELDNALKFFRRSINKAVIVGGDRPALAIAAMETNTSAVILTGGIYPPSSVLSLSEKKGVPVLLVQEDTYSVVQKLTTSPVQGILDVTQTDRLEEWDRIFNQLEFEEIKKVVLGEG